jgi:hypothetical protein
LVSPTVGVGTEITTAKAPVNTQTLLERAISCHAKDNGGAKPSMSIIFMNDANVSITVGSAFTVISESLMNVALVVAARENVRVRSTDVLPLTANDVFGL